MFADLIRRIHHVETDDGEGIPALLLAAFFLRLEIEVYRREYKIQGCPSYCKENFYLQRLSVKLRSKTLRVDLNLNGNATKFSPSHVKD